MYRFTSREPVSSYILLLLTFEMEYTHPFPFSTLLLSRSPLPLRATFPRLVCGSLFTCLSGFACCSSRPCTSCTTDRPRLKLEKCCLNFYLFPLICYPHDSFSRCTNSPWNGPSKRWPAYHDSYKPQPFDRPVFLITTSSKRVAFFEEPLHAGDRELRGNRKQRNKKKKQTK